MRVQHATNLQRETGGGDHGKHDDQAETPTAQGTDGMLNPPAKDGFSTMDIETRSPSHLECQRDLHDSAPARHEPDHPQTNSEDSELEQALAVSASLQNAKEVSAAAARERLKHVMELYQATTDPVKADGNCQFRALSHQLYGDEDHHSSLRARVVRQLQERPQLYLGFVHESYSEYVKRMACDGEWGDNVTLQAASDALCAVIHVLTDVPGAECVEVCPIQKMRGSHKPLCLTFLTEVHYDSAQVA